MTVPTELFKHQGSLDDLLGRIEGSVPDRIERIPRDQFLNTADQDLIEHVVSSVRVVPLVVDKINRTMESEESELHLVRGNGSQYTVDSLKLTVYCPIAGDDRLWSLQPNPSPMEFPRGTIALPKTRGAYGTVSVEVHLPSDSPPERFKSRLENAIESISRCVEVQRKQIDVFNARLDEIATRAVAKRRQRLQSLDAVTRVLDIPLRPAAGAPAFTPIQVDRIVKPLPPAPATGFKPEPGIANGIYEHILTVIRHEGRTWETTPKTYAMHDEEELRDIIVSHLNTHFQGAATGETFRRSGKTDIRIEDNGRAAFVAECKVWRGEKELLKAIDQLAAYLTWRDCKAAVAIFNKHVASFTDLLTKVPDAFRSHPQFKRELSDDGSGEWRFVLRSKEDAAREITVHVFAFNVFVEKQKKQAPPLVTRPAP